MDNSHHAKYIKNYDISEARVFAVNFSQFSIIQEVDLDERVHVCAKKLRCLDCSGQILSESNSAFAGKVRQQIKDLIVLGRSDMEIMHFLHEQYGDEIFLSYTNGDYGNVITIVLCTCLCVAVVAPIASYYHVFNIVRRKS